MTPAEPWEVISWAKSLLADAEEWPDDGPHFQPKKYVRALVQQLKVQVLQARKRERELKGALEEIATTHDTSGHLSYGADIAKRALRALSQKEEGDA